MHSYISAVIFLVIVFIFLMMFFIAVGRHVGNSSTPSSKFSVTEGVVFTLMGLLVAFSFASAGQRFDARRSMIIDEANAISTAYLRLDILKESDRKIVQNDFLSYVNSRLAIYQAVPNFNLVETRLGQSNLIQKKLWEDAVKGCNNASLFAPMLILPSINTMFDIANTRTAYIFIHMPYLVFGLLILMALLSAFLTGYGMSGERIWSSLHVIAFIMVITVTIYIIFDLEFPRLGFITENQMDFLLVDVKNNMLQNQ